MDIEAVTNLQNDFVPDKTFPKETNLSFDVLARIIVCFLIIYAIKILRSLSETDRKLKTLTTSVHEDNKVLMNDLKFRISDLNSKIIKLENNFNRYIIPNINNFNENFDI